MSKKPFVNPSIKLKSTIKDLRKEARFWENEYRKTLRKLERLKKKHIPWYCRLPKS